MLSVVPTHDSCAHDSKDEVRACQHWTYPVVTGSPVMNFWVFHRDQHNAFPSVGAQNCNVRQLNEGKKEALIIGGDKIDGGAF